LTGLQSETLASLLRLAKPVTEKIVEQFTVDVDLTDARAKVVSLVWGPGAGAEGGREALVWP